MLPTSVFKICSEVHRGTLGYAGVYSPQQGPFVTSFTPLTSGDGFQVGINNTGSFLNNVLTATQQLAGQFDLGGGGSFSIAMGGQEVITPDGNTTRVTITASIILPNGLGSLGAGYHAKFVLPATWRLSAQYG